MTLIHILFSFKGSSFTSDHKRYICHGCKKKWCTVMNNDNSSNLCTRMQLQQTDGYCSKCQNTKDLQPQKDDNNNTSPTPSTTYDGLYKKDKRLCNSKHSTKTIIENLSDKKTNSIINIVESTFQLTTNNGSTSKFESMIEAKEYFVRKFSYMGIITSKATNMFNFVCPESCRNITDIVDYPKYEKFHVDRKAITSIYDTNWLDDSAVNLVLACLNYVSINITKQSVVPKYLFRRNPIVSRVAQIPIVHTVA